MDVTSGGLNAYASFATSEAGLQLLWLVATGESWSDFLVDAGQDISAVVFFCSFLLVMQFVMLNLFTLVITEAFEVMRAIFCSRTHLGVTVNRSVASRESSLRHSSS